MKQKDYMTRWSKWFLGILFASTASFCSAQSSNIFSYKNSLEYAEHLIETHQYNLALTELDRLINLYPDTTTLKEIYIKVCYNSKKYKLGETKVKEWYITQHKIMPTSIMIRYNYLLLEQDDYEEFSVFAKSNNVSSDLKEHLSFNSALLFNNWGMADSILKHTPSSEFTNTNLSLLNEGRTMKFKSPFNGALYSTLIPGMGKIYARDTKDGVYSFIAVAVPAISAIRGFNKRGSESVYGWINLGLASTMYVGNIYGAVRSVRQYNKNKKQQYHAKVKANIYNIY